MTFNLRKAISSTHRNPLNRTLHIIGLPIYIGGWILIIGFITGLHTNPVIGVTMWSLAICFFLTGHKIEGNLRAMTMIVLFKYLKSKISVPLLARYSAIRHCWPRLDPSNYNWYCVRVQTTILHLHTSQVLSPCTIIEVYRSSIRFPRK